MGETKSPQQKFGNLGRLRVIEIKYEELEVSQRRVLGERRMVGDQLMTPLYQVQFQGEGASKLVLHGP